MPDPTVLIIGGLAAIYVLSTWLSRTNDEHSPPPERVRPPRAQPIDYSAEMRRVGPEQRRRIPGGRL